MHMIVRNLFDCYRIIFQISKTIFNFPGEGIFEVNLDNDDIDIEIKKMHIQYINQIFCLLR